MRTFIQAFAILIVLCNQVAQAQPFSGDEERFYVQTQLARIAQADGFQLLPSSIEIHGSKLNYLNPVYNVSPFRLITGPTDDRAYNVNFKVKRDSQIFNGQVHFRTTKGSDCIGRNNTTVRQVSSTTGILSCLSLHASIWANQLGDFVRIDRLLIDP